MCEYSSTIFEKRWYLNIQVSFLKKGGVWTFKYHFWKKVVFGHSSIIFGKRWCLNIQVFRKFSLGRILNTSCRLEKSQFLYRQGHMVYFSWAAWPWKKGTISFQNVLNISQFTWRKMSEDLNLQQHQCEKLKSCKNDISLTFFSNRYKTTHRLMMYLCHYILRNSSKTFSTFELLTGYRTKRGGEPS